VCEFLHRTPSEIGLLRQKHPDDISFIEYHILWEAEERYKANKELERKSKSRRHR
jgi:hypothetical protein